ncbi:MAG: beta-agarase, partial [Armatimonadota bacterium]
MPALLKALIPILAILAAFLASEGMSQAQKVLFDFEEGFHLGGVEVRGVKVTKVRSGGGSALRIASGHDQDWPGITLKAPEGRWDLSKYEAVALEVKNVGGNDVTVACRVDNPGADGVRNCNTGHIMLKAGESGTLKVMFKRKPPRDPNIKLWAMRGYPEGLNDGDRTIEPANVTQILVFVPRPREDHTFEIDNVRAVGEYVAPDALGMTADEFFPFIDAYGQYIHKDWPGKTHSAEDLVQRLEAERAELRDRPGPPDWDEYGGWEAGPTLEATGFFRTEKYKGKWWLVDPKGKLFFSHGIDCVGFNDDTPIEDREHWFADLPSDAPEFRGFFRRAGRVIRDYYQGKKPMCFDFGGANIKRKYGDNWRQQFADISHRRLRSWGFNTIGNWSDPSIYLMRKTPYVVAIHFGAKPLQGSKGYWGRFHDVFDPDFRARLRARMAREVGKTAGDPWCIGYFVDNEIAWGDEISLAVAALVSPPDQAAKQVFVADLKGKYETIEALNEAWGTDHASWEAVLQNQKPPDTKRA